MGGQSSAINLIDLISIGLQLLPFIIKIGFQLVRNRIKRRGISGEARKIALAIDRFSWTNLQKTVPVIERVGLINRIEIEEIKDFWDSSDNPLLLHGEAGTGKSGIALRLGQALAKDGMPVLFLISTDFPNDQDPIIFIQNRMSLSIPLMVALTRLSEETTFVVIVDQLDSIAGTELVKTLVGFLKALAANPKIKILAVSRTHEIAQDPDISTLRFQKIESGRLSTSQTMKYLSRIGLIEPSRAVQDLANNLLNLSLISDVFTHAPNRSTALINEIELWKQFVETIRQREGDEIEAFVLKLAREVTKKGDRNFFVEFPNSEIKRKLLSRAILVDAPGRRFTFRHEQLQDFLCAYSILPERPGLQQLRDEFGENLPKTIISWIHLLYHSEKLDIEADFVDSILSARDYLPFFTRAIILENLRQQGDPSLAVAGVLVKHFSDWAYQRYFFDGFENPSWIDPLHSAGLFFMPPDPVETDPGYYHLPRWSAGEYLARFASQYEEIIVDVVSSIRTDNWRVHAVLIDALTKISPTRAAHLVDRIDPWTEEKFSTSTPEMFLPLAEHFCRSNMIEAAIQILNSVITPILPESGADTSTSLLSVRFRSDPYWVNEYCKKQFPELIARDPSGVVSTYERQLVKAIELAKQEKGEDAERYVISSLRPDISHRLYERGNAGILDTLIEGLRDSLAVLCSQDPEVGSQYLQSFLISEHLILMRIGLFTLRRYGDQYPDLLNKAFPNRDDLKKGELRNEYLGLIRDQFPNVSVEIQAEVIEWVLSGPIDLETRARRRAEIGGGEITDDLRCTVKEHWILYHLQIIRDSLTGKALDLLNSLVEKYGAPDVTERPHRITTSWGGAPSPVPAEELAKKSFDELKQILLNYVPSDSFMDSRENLALVLQGLVRDDPSRYCDFAPFLVDQEVRFVYIYHYLAGFRESLKDKSSKLGESTIDLCEYVTAQQKDPFDGTYSFGEPGLFAAQLEVARLLEEALGSNDPYLSREMLNRIKTLLTMLVHHPDPEESGDAGTSFDPFTHSLNCVMGVGMHGIMEYSLYVIRQREKLQDGKPKTGFMEPDIQKILDEKLDITREPSLAVHSVFGAFLPQIHYMSDEWLKTHLEMIFPQEEERSTYWEAAWDAYIFASNVYKNVFDLLILQYQRGLDSLQHKQDEKKHLGGSLYNRLAQHVLMAYLNGWTGFGHENQLLDKFFSNATDEVRASGVFWLSKVLENEENSQNGVWAKCWSLWQNRLAFAETQEVSANKQELSNYMRWLENCPAGLDILYPTLKKSIKYLDDQFDVRQLTSYLAEYAPEYSHQAAELLQMAILTVKEAWWHSEKEDMEIILRSAIESKDLEARRIAIEIINYWGENGNFYWKFLLE